MKNRILVLVGLLPAIQSFAQDIYVLKSSKIHFYAGTPIEDIEADNTKASSFLNTKTGEVLIGIPNKSFQFKNALMEEHFNENYMESDKFPKSEFKGKIQEPEKYDFTKAGSFNLKLEGTLTVHGISKPRTIEVVMRKEGEKLIGESKFTITLTDHGIQRPQILWEKLSENVEITASFYYEAYAKK